LSKEWDTYRAPGGRDKVADDVRKARLTAHEKVRLKELMEACAAGQLRYPTIKPLSGTPGLMELRLILEDRSFRLVYAEIGGGLVLLALHLFRKQASSQPAQIREAVRRYKTWRSA
jgi:phage-related protein